MRTLKLACALGAALGLALVATAAANAAETLWLWLPGATGTKFTGKSAKVSLQIKGSGTVTCKETFSNGELTGEQTLGLATIDFGNNCTAGGLPANSLGDASGTILVHAEIHNCRITANNHGVLFKFLPLHIEVPSTKLLILVEGSYIAETAFLNIKLGTHPLLVEQKEGKQAIENCEGGPKGGYTLTTSLDGGEPKQTAIEAKEGTITWTSSEQEVML